MNDKEFPWNIRIVFTLPTQPYHNWPTDPVEEALEDMNVFPEAMAVIDKAKHG